MVEAYFAGVWEGSKRDRFGKDPTMATRIPGTGVDAAPAGGLFRRAVARMIAAREIQARRTVNAYLLSLDDSTLATFGYDRRALEETAHGPFPF